MKTDDFKSAIISTVCFSAFCIVFVATPAFAHPPYPRFAAAPAAQDSNQQEAQQRELQAETQRQYQQSYRRFQDAHSAYHPSGATQNGVINERVGALEQEKQQLLNQRRMEFDREATRIQADADRESSGIPERVSTGRRSFRNPEYDEIVRDAKERATIKLDQLRRNFEHDAQDIERSYDGREQSFSESANDLSRRPVSSRETVQLAPANNNIYVHNYMNFGSSEPVVQPIVPLRAAEGKFNATPQKH